MFTRLPIKYLLPLILLLFSLAATSLIYLVDRTQLIQGVEKRVLREVEDRLTGMQGTLELLLELKELDGAARQLAAFSALPDNRSLLITDPQGVVIASNRQADRGRTLGETHPEVSAAISAEVINHRHIETRLAEDGRWVDAYSSVCTRGDNTLRRDRCGLLYHRIDLGYHQRIALQPLNAQTRNIAVALTVASLLLGYLIHLLLFRRTEQLAAVVSRYAQGERTVRSGVQGHDEVARLATNVDAMMERIEADEQALQAKERHLNTLFNSVRDPIVVTTLRGEILSFNRAGVQLFGYETAQVLGRNINILMPQRDQTAHDAHLARYHAGVKNSTVIGRGRELTACKADGEEFPVEVTITELRDGSEVQLIGVIRDITERKQAEQQLERLAYYDPLTRLPNRALYRDRLERELLQAQRRGHTSALLFIDLDRFKQVNDTLGHDVGDDLLIAVAERLTGCVRASDTVCRLGGDEFTVILSDVEGREGVSRVAQAIIERLQQTFPLHGHAVQIGGSVGIALIPQDAADFIEANKKADIAMYHAKSAGRGNYQFYSDELK